MTHATPHQAKRRVLLALDSARLPREIQLAALKVCIRLRAPLDILVAQPNEEDQALPAALILQLEHSGLDYRYAQAYGPLSDAVRRYLARSRTPSTVIVAKASKLAKSCHEALQVGGHELIDLSAPPSDETLAASAPHTLTKLQHT